MPRHNTAEDGGQNNNQESPESIAHREYALLRRNAAALLEDGMVHEACTAMRSAVAARIHMMQLAQQRLDTSLDALRASPLTPLGYARPVEAR